MINKDLIRILITEKNDYKTDVSLTKEDFVNLVKTKISGFISQYVNNGLLKADEEMKDLLCYSIRLNKIRNVNLINGAIDIDNILEGKNVKRVWLKGISDIYNFPSYINTRKLSDIDILVDDANRVRKILMENGFHHGAYSHKGQWVTASEEEIKEFEDNDYELFPLSKTVQIPNLNEYNMSEELLTTFRIQRTDYGFSTDLCLDVHHGLTFDLDTNWMLKTGYLPMMNEIDIIWYLANKVYHEIIIGTSINLQSLLITLNYIRQTKIKPEDVLHRQYKTGYYNDEPLNLLYSMANGNIQNDELDKITEKIEGKVIGKEYTK